MHTHTHTCSTLRHTIKITLHWNICVSSYTSFVQMWFFFMMVDALQVGQKGNQSIIDSDDVKTLLKCTHHKYKIVSDNSPCVKINIKCVY